MFTANLFVIAKNWKELKYLSSDEKINMLFPYTGTFLNSKQNKTKQKTINTNNNINESQTYYSAWKSAYQKIVHPLSFM